MTELDAETWGREMAEWDWLVFGRWDRLHHATLTPKQYEELGNNSYLDETITLTCGIRASRPGIPGLFTRAGCLRCAHCCDRLGYPRGVGSPKNDDACRASVRAKLSA